AVVGRGKGVLVGAYDQVVGASAAVRIGRRIPGGGCAAARRDLLRLQGCPASLLQIQRGGTVDRPCDRALQEDAVIVARAASEIDHRSADLSSTDGIDCLCDIGSAVAIRSDVIVVAANREIIDRAAAGSVPRVRGLAGGVAGCHLRLKTW